MKHDSNVHLHQFKKMEKCTLTWHLYWVSNSYRNFFYSIFYNFYTFIYASSIVSYKLYLTYKPGRRYWRAVSMNINILGVCFVRGLTSMQFKDPIALRLICMSHINAALCLCFCMILYDVCINIMNFTQTKIKHWHPSWLLSNTLFHSVYQSRYPFHKSITPWWCCAYGVEGAVTCQNRIVREGAVAVRSWSSKIKELQLILSIMRQPDNQISIANMFIRPGKYAYE